MKQVIHACEGCNDSVNWLYPCKACGGEFCSGCLRDGELCEMCFDDHDHWEEE